MIDDQPIHPKDEDQHIPQNLRSLSSDKALSHPDLAFEPVFGRRKKEEKWTSGLRSDSVERDSGRTSFDLILFALHVWEAATVFTIHSTWS